MGRAPEEARTVPLRRRSVELPVEVTVHAASMPARRAARGRSLLRGAMEGLRARNGIKSEVQLESLSSVLPSVSSYVLVVRDKRTKPGFGPGQEIDSGC